MKITVFGATGMVGQRVVNLALAQGHQVVAFGRNVASLIDRDLQSDAFKAVKGAVFSPDDVLDALSDCDAVISVLGGGTDGEDKTRSLGLKNIVQQMNIAGVKRIVAVGGLGVLDAGDGTYLLHQTNYPAEYLAVGNEHLKAFEHIQESSLDWTFVCPPTIKDADGDGHYLVSDNILPVPNRYYINAGDLALFMLNELQDNKHIKQRVGISAT